MPMIPILQKGMEEALQCPSPTITGILRTHLDYICETDREIVDHIDNYAMIVNIDSQNEEVAIQFNNYRQADEPYLDNLKEMLVSPFEILNDYKNRTLSELREAVMQVYELTKYTLKLAIQYKLP